MPRRPSPRRAVLLATAALLLALPARAQAPSPSPGAPARSAPALALVAEFPSQVTGVTAAPDGRVFVSFPRWTEDAPVSVAEVMGDGTARPYPNDAWNAWRNTRQDELDPAAHFVCVQSVVADGRGSLWVLDPAAPGQDKVIAGGPKLVRIDLATNRVAGVIRFDERAAPQGSYLNDVRFSPDGRRAYVTDSGAKGALLVVDLATGAARRVLDGHPSTQAEKGVVVSADGRPVRRPDGRGVAFAADGIALSTDGATLYWQAIKGRTLHSAPTAALDDAALPAAALERQVARAGVNGVADGLLIDRRGRLLVTAPEEDAVKVRAPRPSGEFGEPEVLVKDPRLRWPDTLSEGPDGGVYVTTSRIQDMSWYKPESPARLPTRLWRIGAR